MRPYGIRSRTIRIGELVGRGYVKEEMIETFRRYIPKSELETAKAELRERVEREGETNGPDAGKAKGACGAVGDSERLKAEG